MDSADYDHANNDRDDSDSWDQVDYEETLEDVELLELSESQLREEYDNEEIERFLALFASVSPILAPSSALRIEARCRMSTKSKCHLYPRTTRQH